MALKPLNSVGGFSVGEIANVVIDGEGNITSLNANLGNLATANFANVSTNLNVTGNAIVGNILTNNIKYANGAAWNFGQDPGGSNTQIQFNDDGNFGGSSAFTFNSSSNVLTVSGNANVNNLGTSQVLATANVTTPQLIANIANGSAPLVVNSQTLVANLNADLLDGFNSDSGNTGNTIALRDANGNISANYFIGDGSQLTGVASAGNLANGTSSVTIPTANGNVNTSVGGVANVFVVSTTGANVTGNLSVSGNANVGNLGATEVIATTLAGSLTTNAQPNITSVGNLSALTVTGNLSAANANLGNAVIANFFIGSGANLSNINGSNVTGTVANANYAAFAGDVVNASQPNITSVGTLSNLTVSGNASAGNLSTGGNLSVTGNSNVANLAASGAIEATGNITSNANVVTDLIVGRTTSVSIAATGTNQNIYLKPTGTGVVDVWGAKISNVAMPVASTDVATKQYVDEAVQGLNVHDSCKAATTGTLDAASGGTVSYNNGTAGVGATLTTTATYTTIDGVNIATVGTRILVKNEANAAWNGVYVYTSSTVLTRADDYNTVPEVEAGDFIFVQDGTINNDSGFVQTSVVTTIGTDPINFVQFSGAGTYTAGTGLTLNGTQFSISNTTVTAGSYGNGDAVATFTVNAQGQLTAAANTAITANAANLSGTTLNANIVNSSLTSVGTLTGLAVNGNITAINITANTGAFTGNAAGLTNIPGANVTGTVANATHASTANTVTDASQPNITSVGTLSSLSVTGNVAAGNVTTTGQLVSSVANGTAPLTVSSQTLVANLNADLLDGFNSDSGDTGNTIALRTSTGNLAANYFVGNGAFLTGIATAGNLANGNSNVTIPVAAGNVLVSVNGNANILVITDTGANVNGYLTTSGNLTSGNANLGNLAVANFVNVASNLVTHNLTVNLELSGNTANFTGAIIAQNVTANSTVFAANANVSGTAIANLLTVNNAITGNTANFSGNVVVPNLTVNLALAGNTANFSGNVLVPNLSVNLELAGNTANFTGNVSVGNFVTTGLANVGNLNVAGNVVSALTPNANLSINLGSSNQRWNFLYVGEVQASGNLAASNFSTTGNVAIGNSTIEANTVTTTTTTLTTISSVPASGVTGVDFIVKGIDSSGAKYSVAHITAVTNGSTVDYTTYGLVNIGTTTGTLSVAIVGSNIALQVTPSSANSTVWTTQFRLI